MKPAHLVLFGASLVLATALGFMLRGSTGHEPGSVGGKSQAPNEPGSNAQATPMVDAVNGADKSSASAPLPMTIRDNAELVPAAVLYDAKTPLRDRLADLDHNARRGDARAACTMAREMDRCREAIRMRRTTMSPEMLARMLSDNELSQQQIDRQITQNIERNDRLDAIGTWCEGVEPDRWLAAVDYHLMAANAGHPVSMQQALKEWRYPTELLFREPRLISTYRMVAPQYFDALLRAGDAGVAELLSEAMRDSRSILLNSLPAPYNTPGFAQAFVQEMQPGRRGPLNPTEEERRAAADLYDRHAAAFQAANLRGKTSFWHTSLGENDPCDVDLSQ